MPERTRSAWNLEALLANSRNIHSNSVDAGARRDVKRSVVYITECDVGYKFGYENRAQVFAFRRNDPHAARAGFVHITLRVHFHAVGDSAGRIRTHVDEHLTIRERIVGLHIVAPNVFVLAAIRVKTLFIG